jgi:hypothetical protein
MPFSYVSYDKKDDVVIIGVGGVRRPGPCFFDTWSGTRPRCHSQRSARRPGCRLPERDGNTMAWIGGRR